MRSHKDIYPPEMELKVENKNKYSSPYLDLVIELNEGIIEIKRFDKSKTGKFSEVHMSYKRSNMPKMSLQPTVLTI